MVTFDIGKRLSDEALRRGLSHHEAAEQLGVSQATFSRWASGENVPHSNYWTVLARFLGMSRDKLAGELANAQSRRGARGVRGVNERIDELERQMERIEGLLSRLLGGPKRPRNSPPR